MADKPKWKWRVSVEPNEEDKDIAAEFDAEAKVFREGTCSFDTFDEVVAACRKHIPELLEIEYVVRIDEIMEEIYG